MARKIQRKDLRKPDEFVDVGTRILNWISDHRAALGISLAAGLVLIFGVMLVVYLRRSANVEEWRGLMDAVPVRSMPKGEMADPLSALGKQEPAVWVDSQRILGVASGGESDAVRRLADLAAAGDALAKGDGAAAEQRYRAFLAGNPPSTSPGRLIAQEGLGYALELQQKPAEAAQVFAVLGELSDGAYKALALYHQGRLDAAAGRDEEARKALLAAKAIPDPHPTDVVPRIESWLRVLDLRAAPPAAPPAAPATATSADAGTPQGDAPTLP
ncbi:MAG: hypothetical protein HY907_07385 [Deltaproteobacteria bacterium]|nr:hypothetical protein [Deltaproteobacteria bacterium]